MDRMEIADLEDAGREAMAWVPESHEGTPRHSLILAGILLASGIIAAAAILLLAAL